MRYEISEHGTDVEIHVRDTAGRTSQLLTSMQDCQAGQCACPTDQYNRLAAMEVRAGDDDVTVRLQPLPGERLDPEELQTCLDYTLTHTEDGG